MILVIETIDEQAVRTLMEVAKSLRVSVRLEQEKDLVSEQERQRRLAILKKFKGGLQQFGNGYKPSKNEWYEQ
jgi:hypothetical protein